MTQVQPNHLITVRPAIPMELLGLRELAYDLWWAWNPDAQDLFRRIDPDAWQSTHHNPVALLGHVSPDQLVLRAADAAFMHDLQRWWSDGGDTWRRVPGSQPRIPGQAT